MLELKAGQLKEALNLIRSNTQVPLRLESNGACLFLTISDSKTQYQTRVAIASDSKFQVTIPFKTIYSLLSTMDGNSDVRLSDSNSGGLLIESECSRHFIPSPKRNTNSLPDLASGLDCLPVPSTEVKNLEVKNLEVKNLLEAIILCSKFADSSPRGSILDGISIERQNTGVVIRASDGYKFLTYKAELPTLADILPSEFVLPGSLGKFLKCVKLPLDVFSIGMSGSHLRIDSPTLTLTTRLEKTEYPTVSQHLIDEPFTFSFRIGKSNLIQLLNRLSCSASSKKSFLVCISESENHQSKQSIRFHLGDIASEVVPVDYLSGKVYPVVLKGHHLLECLKGMPKCNWIEIGIRSETSPISVIGFNCEFLLMPQPKSK